MVCVNECITKDNNEVAFRNTCGMTVESFLQLLHSYLNNTHVGFGDETFIQTTGVCIGSKVAPVLSTIFLSSVDRELAKDLDGVVTKVFRYVDDYLVVGSNVDKEVFTRRVLDAFKLRGKGLMFTS